MFRGGMAVLSRYMTICFSVFTFDCKRGRQLEVNMPSAGSGSLSNCNRILIL